MQHRKLKKNICNLTWRHSTFVCQMAVYINYPLIVIWKYKNDVWLTVFFFFFLKTKSAPGFPHSLIVHLPPLYPGLASMPENTQNRERNMQTHTGKLYFKYTLLLLLQDSWSAAQHPTLRKNLICVWSCQELLSARIHDLSGLLVCCIWVSPVWLLKNLSLKGYHRINSIL